MAGGETDGADKYAGAAAEVASCVKYGRMARPFLRRLCAALFVVCVTVVFPHATMAQAAAKAAQNSPVANVHTSDSVDLIRETQIGIRESDYAGLIWWIPFEFWEYAGARQNVAPERMAETFNPLKKYSVVALFAAKVTPLGGFQFYSPDELRKKTVLRDAAGTEYTAMDEVSPEAQTVSAVMKPILSNAMGKAGENFALLFYPATGKTGKTIADARATGQFSVVIKDLLGSSESVYQWRLPLTSVAPPKFCPVGKERVNANWSYCPWHGVKLEGSTAAASK